MGVAIIDKTSLFDPVNALGKLVPVMNGLTALHFDGKARGLNQKINGSAFTVVGSPVNENDNVTDYSETAYVKTQQPCTDEGTFIAVVRLFKNDGAINNTILGWYANTGSRGVSLLIAATSRLMLSCTVLASDGVTKNNIFTSLPLSNFTSDAVYTAGKWGCVAGRWYKNSSGLFTLKVNNLTEDTSAELTAPTGSTLVTNTLGNPLIIGSGYVSADSQGGGTKAMGCSAIYNRALSDIELKMMYSGYLQMYFSRRGIAI